MYDEKFVDMAIKACGMYDKDEQGYPSYDRDGAVEMLRFILGLGTP